jgi:hypothetical protein
MTADEIIVAAAQYARAGWRVFPVSPSTKRPMTAHGHLDATSDPDAVLELWRDRFGSIATPTGDGFMVIDIDPRNGGVVPPWAPPTRSVRTQSGGTHLHYAIDRDIKSRAGLFGPGIDSKSAGGYVLLPPSPGYSWNMDGESGEVLPRAALKADWLLTKISPTQRTGATGGAERLPPNQWRRGIIHDQVVAWAGYFAAVLDDEREIEAATWDMVNRAKEAGTNIDNARNHIGTAISWVLERERNK